MAQTALEKVSGMGGFLVISNTSPWTGQAESVVINSDAVFTTFTTGDSALATKGLTGVTMKGGAYLPCDPGKKITAITLASGSVIIYF